MQEYHNDYLISLIDYGNDDKAWKARVCKGLYYYWILINSFLKEYNFLFGIFLSNLLFASLHYFTLRWKLKACIFTFLGGLGLSRLFYVTEDLALIILVHWAITFLNTPTAPNNISTEK